MGHAGINPQTIENSRESTLFVAAVPPDILERAQRDLYSTHIVAFFGDPPNIRPVTTEEIRILMSHAQYNPDGTNRETPNNLDNVVNRIFTS